MDILKLFIYNKGSKPNPNNKDRWYSNKSIGLAPLCCCVRHHLSRYMARYRSS